MAKLTKKHKAQADSVDREKFYAVDEALALVKQNATSKFDETVEIALNLGVDPRHADTRKGSVHRQPGFDANEHQIERIRESIHDLALAAVGFGCDEDGGKIKPCKGRYDDDTVDLQQARHGSGRPEEAEQKHRQGEDEHQPYERVHPRGVRRRISCRGQPFTHRGIASVDQ